jgi:Protein of unknown function (DUF2630)
MQDSEVMDHIEALVAEEHTLREKEEHELTDAEQTRLKKLEVDLDRYWDLMRQRRSLREVGDNPDDASIRDENTVEGYEQ